MRDSTIIYRSFYESIVEIPEKNQAEVWRAIFEFSLNFKEVELTGLSKTIFTLIKPQLEANIKRFRNGNKTKIKKQTGSKTEAKQKREGSKTEANNNVNVNHNVNHNVNENENLNAEILVSSSSQKSESENPKKKVPRKKKEILVSDDGKKFTEWVIKKIDPVPVRETTVPKIGPMYDKLIRLGYTKDEIKMAVDFAVTDDFWREQFLSPMKLDTPDKHGTKFIDVFIAKAKLKTGVKPQKKPDNSSVAHLKVYE